MSFHEIAALGAVIIVIGLSLAAQRYLTNYRRKKRQTGG
jgi:MFS superfamily sulfate permease-like transporter